MKPKYIPDCLLERYMLGELPAARMRAINRRLKHDPGLRQRLEEFRKSDADILRAYPPAAILPAVKRRARQQAAAGQERQGKMPWLRRCFYPLAGLAASAAVLAVVMTLPGLRPSGQMRLPGEETVRSKGLATQLFIYGRKDHGFVLLHDQDTVAAGDVLQIAYFSQQDPYGVILSIDGQGGAVLHYPGGRQAAAILATRRKTLLAKAYELDRAPAFERFFLLTSDSALDVDRIMRTAEAFAGRGTGAQSGDLPLDESIRQISVLLKKSSP